MANPRDVKQIPITWTSDKSQPILVSDFRDVVLTIVGTGTATVLGTTLVPKNATATPVDFTTSSTITNPYAAVVIADLTTANTYATSLAVAGATKMGEVNTNLLTYICVTRSAGTLDAFITVCDNQ
ncbi:MAG: hypothetical protein ACP5N7_01975 [Candidatus Pacearchaeota archaeon]